MSYAIGYIVYGVNLRKVLEDNPALTEDINCIEEADLATSRYSGHGDPPLYLGVDKGSIDECSDIKFSNLIKHQVVTEQDKRIFNEARDKLLSYETFDSSNEEHTSFSTIALTKEFKAWLVAQEPTLFITWGSS